MIGKMRMCGLIRVTLSQYNCCRRTWLVKEMHGLLAPFVALLFNKSLDTGCFPAEFKQAVVRPLLKKSGLDTAEMKNYRPVSNLSFLSKFLEKVDRFETGL